MASDALPAGGSSLRCFAAFLGVYVLTTRTGQASLGFSGCGVEGFMAFLHVLQALFEFRMPGFLDSHSRTKQARLKG